MRPLRLHMLGFGTFREETEINFADLELFALVGGTGSGKSTVIDAITFALFGRIARLDAGSVAPVINALSIEARIVFEFEVSGTNYTAARIVRRKGPGATTTEARLESDGEVLAEGPKELSARVEHLLGLNFDRFNRVVVLPQGKFAAFLHDKPSARQQLMRQLLDLGIYERLGRRARSITTEAAAQLEVLRPRLETGRISDEAFAALEKDRDAVAAIKVALANLLAARNNSIAAQVEAARISHDLGVLVMAVADLDIPAEVVKLGDELAQANAVQEAAAHDLGLAEEAVERAVLAFEAGPDLGECRRLLKVHDEFAAATVSTETLAVTLEAAAESRDKSAARLVELEAHLTETDDRVAEAEVAEKKALAALADGPSRTDLDKAYVALEALEIVEVELEPAERAVDTAVEQVATTAIKLQAAEEQASEAVAEVRRIEQQNHAHVLVGSLVQGSACPVCQQTVDEIPSLESVSELETAIAAQAKAEHQLEKARAATGKAERQQATHDAQLAEVKARLKAARKVASSVLPASELKAQMVEIDHLENAAKDATSKREEASVASRALRASDDLRIARTDGSDMASLHTRTEEQLKAAQDAATDLEKQFDGKPSKPELTTMITDAEQRESCRVQAIAAAKLAAEANVAATQGGATVRESDRALRQKFTSTWAAFVGIDPPEPEGASLLDDWKAFVGWAATQQAPLETELEKATQGSHVAAAQVAEDDKAIRKLTGELDGADELEIDELESFVVQLSAERGSAFTAAQTRRKELEEDVAQVKKLEESQQVHGILGNRLLKSSGFEQWMMEEVIQALVGRASERLYELSNGQYSIESDEMDFEVRDHRNGDELRDARTLSGGETFLASLALALALADSLHAMAPAGTPPLESLFLDEGFGTLDAETLDVVAAAIEELGASGRMVGIITHITELAERMPVRFEVTKEAATSVATRVER